MLTRLHIGSEKSSIRALHSVFQERDYNETALSQRLDVPCLSRLEASLLPYYLWLCRDDSEPLSVLARVFLLRGGVAPTTLSKILGRTCVSVLKMSGILGRERGQLYSKVAIYPCDDLLVVTDHWVVQGPHHQGHVYELGQDSYSLARLTPRPKSGSSLDLCTGSGVHAIASASQGMQSAAVDINPRALEYSAFNAGLNGVNLATFSGDLYAPVTQQRFRLITVNPPFVPSFEKEVLIHRSPGVSGEEVSERLLRGLSQHLEGTGLFSMILNYPLRSEDTYLDRLQCWLGETRGWLIVVLKIAHEQLGSYIRAHLLMNQEYQTKFEAYLSNYEEQGILAMAGANVFVRRLGFDRPNVLLELETEPPTADVSDQVEDWLEALVKAQEPGARLSDFSLSHTVEQVWSGDSDSERRVDLKNSSWLPTPKLSRAESLALSQIEEGVEGAASEGLQGLVAKGVVSCLGRAKTD